MSSQQPTGADRRPTALARGQTAWQVPAQEGWTRRNMLAAADESMPVPTPLEEYLPRRTNSFLEHWYLFDLRGYSVLPNALPAADIRAINDWIDGLQLESRPIGDWEGDVEIHSYYRKPGDRLQSGLKHSAHYDGAEKGINDGWNLQHIYEGGDQFENLLDHPSWYGRVAKYLGQASPFVFELFINVRNPGGFIGMHSGGWKGGLDGSPRPGHIVPRPGELVPTSQSPNGAADSGTEPEWACTLVSIILALNDIGPGDGPTVLVPGSHKAVFEHPGHLEHGGGMTTDGALVEAGEEMYLKAGDALIFNDHCLHGSTARINSGQRRMVCFRYLPQHNSTNRFGYQPSAALMERLTPRRAEILSDLNHPWGLNTPAHLRGRNSPRSSTRQPVPGEEVEPTWLADDENRAHTGTANL